VGAIASAPIIAVESIFVALVGVKRVESAFGIDVGNGYAPLFT